MTVDVTDLTPATEPKITAEKALELLTEDRQRRVEECTKEIEAVLAKHRCGIVPRVEFLGSKVTTGWLVGVTE